MPIFIAAASPAAVHAPARREPVKYPIVPPTLTAIRMGTSSMIRNPTYPQHAMSGTRRLSFRLEHCDEEQKCQPSGHTSQHNSGKTPTRDSLSIAEVQNPRWGSSTFQLPVSRGLSVCRSSVSRKMFLSPFLVWMFMKVLVYCPSDGSKTLAFRRNL